MRILVLNGPNLGTLGRREPEIYGTVTLAEIHDRLRERGRGARTSRCAGSRATTRARSSTSSRRRRGARARLIINPGGLAHTSVVLADALRGFDGPVVEVHLSNILAREDYRRTSHVAEAATAVIAGAGADGYVLALQDGCAARGRLDNGDHDDDQRRRAAPGNTVERHGELLQVLDFAHNKQGRGTADRSRQVQEPAHRGGHRGDVPARGEVRPRPHRAQRGAVPLPGRRELRGHGHHDVRPVPAHPRAARRRAAATSRRTTTLFLLHLRRPRARHRPADVGGAEVTQTDPGFKGDTANAAFKPATRGDRARRRRPAVRQPGRPDPRRHAHRPSTWRGCDERGRRRTLEIDDGDDGRRHARHRRAWPTRWSRGSRH